VGCSGGSPGTVDDGAPVVGDPPWLVVEVGAPVVEVDSEVEVSAVVEDGEPDEVVEVAPGGLCAWISPFVPVPHAPTTITAAHTTMESPAVGFMNHLVGPACVETR